MSDNVSPSLSLLTVFVELELTIRDDVHPGMHQQLFHPGQFSPGKGDAAVVFRYAQYTTEKESIGLVPEQIQNHADHHRDY